MPDVVTDQTAAHDINIGYIPEGYDVSSAEEFRKGGTPRVTRRQCTRP